ncbi:MAG: cell division protein FtsQ/DivIB [Demequina sp.]|nr:cell division protein FtsQ/DivIB [Demequina sp.]
MPTLDVPAGDERVLQSALGVINSLPAELSARVTAISAATEDSVSFRLSKGPLVEWGSAEDSKLKGKVLMALLESKAASKADVIDVSAPTLPITKNN